MTIQDEFLWHIVREGINEKYVGYRPDDLDERVQYEMDVIIQNQFTDYILIVWDILTFCGDENRVREFCKLHEFEVPEYGIIPIGPGRGSVGGSVVCYAIDIHEVDPILFGLHFERFLNPERIAPPDIDMDISQKYRHIVLAYVAWKYGYTAQIITYGTLSARSSLEDVLKSCNVPMSYINRIKETMPQDPELMIADMFDNNKFMKLMEETPFDNYDRQINRNDAVRILNNSNTKLSNDDMNKVIQVATGIIDSATITVINTMNYKTALEMMQNLEKLSKHESTHSGGVVVNSTTLDDKIPLLQKKDILSSQYDMRLLEELGFLKMDMLGLRTVDVNFDAEMLVRKWYDPEFRKKNIPYNDEQAIELIRNGDTVGIFQIESSGFTKMMKDIDIGGYEKLERHLSECEIFRHIDTRDFMWISAGLAMYRPGPLDAILDGKTMVQHVIDRKAGREPVVYLFPEEEQYLSETYGVLVYQEQVMSRVRQMTGCTMGRADKLRKAMGKKDEVAMKYEMDWFIENAMNHNFTSLPLTDEAKRQIIQRAKDEIEKFARYGFNKAHTVEYAHICYLNAYLKSHYPIAFYTALLNSFIDDNERKAIIIKDMTKHGIQMSPPDINSSSRLFTMTDKDTISFGLNAISGLGEKGVNHIITDRNENGLFQSIEEFRARIAGGLCNVNVMKNLAKCGAFDKLINECYCKMENRATLVYSIKYLNDKVNKIKQKKSMKGNVYKILDEVRNLKYEVEHHEVDLIEYATWEKSVLNYFISANPLDAYDDEMFRWTAIDGVNYEDLPQEFYIAGFISGKHEIVVKKEGRNKGKTMAFVTVETKHMTYEATFFPDVYQSVIQYVVNGNAVILKGKRNTYKGETTIQGIYLRNLMNEGIRDCPECYIRLNDVDLQQILELNKICNEHPGITKLYIQIFVNGYDYIIATDKNISVNDRFIDYCNNIGILTYKPI